MGCQFYSGVLQIASFVQMFVLGPRLVLNVREYHAKLAANSDAGTGMSSIAFQERIQISTGSSVWETIQVSTCEFCLEFRRSIYLAFQIDLKREIGLGKKYILCNTFAVLYRYLFIIHVLVMRQHADSFYVK